MFAAVALVCLLDPTLKAASSPRKAVAAAPLSTMPCSFCFANHRWSLHVKAGRGRGDTCGELDTFTLAIQSFDELLIVMIIVDVVVVVVVGMMDDKEENDDDITMNGGAKHPHNKVSEVC